MSSGRRDQYIRDFFQAAVVGDEYEITMYIKDGQNVNVMMEYEEIGKEVSALMLASENGHHDCVERLLRFGADISQLDQNYTNAIIYASHKNLSDRLKNLAAAGLFGDSDGCVKTEFKRLNDLVSQGNFDEVRSLFSDPQFSEQIVTGGLWENTICYLILSGCPKNHIDHVMEGFQIDVNGYNCRGFTPLISAILSGDLEMINYLIGKGADVNKVEKIYNVKDIECTWVKSLKFEDAGDEDDVKSDAVCLPGSNFLNSDEKSPLMYALWSGKMDVVKRLLMTEDLNIDHVDSQKASVLSHAVSAQCLDGIDQLLSHGLDINQKILETRRTALFEAVNAENKDVLLKILNAGADINADDGLGMTALMYAAENGKAESLTVLLEFGGFNVNLVSHGHLRYTALMFAAYKKQFECLKILVDHRADLDLRIVGGETVLDIASEYGDVRCVKFLLEECRKRCSSDDEHNQNVGKLINSAAINKDIDVLKFIFPFCTNINALDSSGVTPLMNAVIADCIENVKFLMQNGADVNIESEDGETALWFAIDDENWECFELLLDAGSDINYVSKDCNLLLVFAAKREDSEYLKCLLEKGSRQVNTLCENSGETPLTAAVKGRRLDNITLLLESGADVNLPDAKGQTPIMFTTRWPEVLQLFLEAGADVNAVDEYEETLWLGAVCNYDCLKILLEDGSVLDKTSTGRRLKSVHRECGISLSHSWDVQSLILLFEYGVFEWDWFVYGGQIGEIDKIAFAALNVENNHPALFKNQEEKMTSLLQEALLDGNIRTVRFLLANLFMTHEDYKTLVSDSDFQQKVREKEDVGNDTDEDTPEIVSVFNRISCQPWRLETLSFLAISTMLSSSTSCQKLTRSEQVDTLALPEILKCKLKFNAAVRKLCPGEWESIGTKGKEEDLLAVTKPLYPRGEDLTECEDDCGLCKGFGYIFI